MSSRLNRKSKGRDRNAIDNSVPQRRSPAIIASIAAPSATTIEVTFATSVLPNKMPLFKAGLGGSVGVTSMNRVSDTVVSFTFGSAVASSNLVVGENDPGIRTQFGGFVPAGTYAIPAAA